MRPVLLCLSLLLAASPLRAEAPLGLSAPAAISETGLLGYILPRFSLKTGIRVTESETGEMALSDGDTGVAVFQGGGVVYRLHIAEDPRQQRFRDWLTSEIGKRTIDAFQVDGAAPFSSDVSRSVAAREVAAVEDTTQGADLSLRLCGRCHVIGEINRMGGVGSTPSFAVLRSLPDWDIRFQQFFVLRPHPAFTIIPDVTLPFDPERPPPIVPIELSLDDLEAILAFVTAMDAADLGAPLQTQ